MLEQLAKMIDMELAAAVRYCEHAYMTKDNYQQTAELFATLSSEEIAHAEKLIREGQRIVDNKERAIYDSKDTADVMYERCKIIWDWEIKLANKEIAEIRYKLSVIRSR